MLPHYVYIYMLIYSIACQMYVMQYVDICTNLHLNVIELTLNKDFFN